METIAKDGEKRRVGRDEVRACKRELETDRITKRGEESAEPKGKREAKPLSIRQQHREEIYIHSGRKRKPTREEETRREDKSALVKIQGRRWRGAIITIHQDNK